jgi:hypothetical protein
MKTLLEQDFISHYRLSTDITVNVVTTNEVKFDLADDSQLVYPPDKGIAKYSNIGLKRINVINYELYFKSLPASFRNDKENCDLIVFTADNACFFLNELTKTNKKKGRKEIKAVSQMLQTLKVLTEVPGINLYINRYKDKRCCYFNKRFQAPKHINAVNAFNRLSTVSTNGFRMSCSDIEAFGFEFWEYSGNQICSL